MSEYNRLKMDLGEKSSEFEKLVDELRSTCNHSMKSGWLPAASSELVVCFNCYKVIESRRRRETDARG